MKGKTALTLATLALLACDTENNSEVIPTLGYEDSYAIELRDEEQLQDAKAYLTEGDLEGLASSVLTSRLGPIRAVQRLCMGSQTAPSGTVVWEENEFDITGFWLFFNSDEDLFTYKLEFEGGFESEIDPDGNLVDLEGQEIQICGNTYTIARANTDLSGLELDMISGKIKTAQDVGHVGMYNIEGVDYEVSIGYWNPATEQAAYLINGEWTGVMNPADIYGLADGTILGHLAMYDAGGQQISEFMLGATKMKWVDTNTNDDVACQSVPEHDFQQIEDGWVLISADVLPSGDTMVIGSVGYMLAADAILGDLYVGRGETVRQHLDEPEGMPGRLDFGYAGTILRQGEQPPGYYPEDMQRLGPLESTHIIEYFMRE